MGSLNTRTSHAAAKCQREVFARQTYQLLFRRSGEGPGGELLPRVYANLCLPQNIGVELSLPVWAEQMALPRLA